MSADLLEAFGVSSTSVNQSVPTRSEDLHGKASDGDLDGEDFGEFESSADPNPKHPEPSLEPEASRNIPSIPKDIIPPGRHFNKRGKPAHLKVNEDRQQLGNDTEILFDADQVLSEDSDFGDFVTVQERPLEDASQQAESQPGRDIRLVGSEMTLLDEALISDASAEKDPTEEKSAGPAGREANLDSLGTQVPTATGEDHDAEAWDDFVDVKLEDAGVFSVPTAAQDSSQSCNFPNPTGPVQNDVEISRSDLPPTNLPPPHIILSTVPAILSSARREFFEPFSLLTQDGKKSLLTDPPKRQYLASHVELAQVMAHVVAGRKLRWKRDKHLAQGMRIGLASGGRAGGMKLAGIDRAEGAKEEKELLDVIQAWRQHIGRLRSALAVANTISHSRKLNYVPELQGEFPIRTVDQTQGGVPAPKPCALCGLKRDERVVRVDEGVQDSFGEWWIEQVSMHNLCWRFWKQQEEQLRGR